MKKSKVAVSSQMAARQPNALLGKALPSDFGMSKLVFRSATKS